MLPPGLRSPRCCRARTPATSSSAARRDACAICRRRQGRHRVAAAAGPGQAAAPRPRRRRPARQCRDAPAQARRRRGGRDLARARRVEAAGAAPRPRPRCSAVDEFLPAVGQGIIAIEARADDARTRALLAAVDHADSATALAAERAFLAVLDGSCRTPIAGHATVDAGRLRFRGLIAKPDGSEVLETRARTAPPPTPIGLGADAGRELKARAGADFFAPGVRRAAAGHTARARRRAHRGGLARARPRRAGGAAAADGDRSISRSRRTDLGAVVMTSANAARAIARHPRRASSPRSPASPSAATPPRPPVRPASAMSAPPMATGTISSHCCAGMRGDSLAASLPGRRGPRRRSRRCRRAGVVTAVVYRAVKAERFPPTVEAALARRALDGVLHFSRRSAEAYLECAGARRPRSTARSRRCISACRTQVAEPLAAAGAAPIRVAPRPEEAALLALVGARVASVARRVWAQAAVRERRRRGFELGANPGFRWRSIRATGVRGESTKGTRPHDQ